MARVITAPGIVRNVSKYLNSMRRVPFSIGKDDWTEVSSSNYTFEFTTAYVTTSSFDIGTFDNSIRSYAKADISMEKKDGGGAMIFTTSKKPSGTVSGSIYIWDNNDNKVPVILEGTTVPIENGGTDATSVAGILYNLGLDSAANAEQTLGFGDAVHKDVANNVTTTSEGYVLDARQGKALKDSVDTLNSNLSDVRTYVDLGNISSRTGLDYWLDRIISDNNLSNNKKLIRFSCTSGFDPLVSGLSYFIDLSASDSGMATAIIQAIAYPLFIYAFKSATGWNYVQNAFGNEKALFKTLYGKNLKISGTGDVYGLLEMGFGSNNGAFIINIHGSYKKACSIGTVNGITVSSDSNGLHFASADYHDFNAILFSRNYSSITVELE